MHGLVLSSVPESLYLTDLVEICPRMPHPLSVSFPSKESLFQRTMLTIAETR